MKIYFTIILIAITLASIAQMNDEDAFFQGTYSKDYIKRHKVKTVTVSQYMDNSIIAPKIFYFDKEGILLYENTLDSNGTEVPFFAFKFDEQGGLIERITRPINGYGADTAKYYKWYKGNQLIEERWPWMPPDFKIVHYYNEKGQEKKSVHPYNGGYAHLTRREVRKEYDNSGKLIHVTDQILQGNSDTVDQWMSDRRIIYKNDKIMKVIERIPNREIPTNMGNIEYTYDKWNNILSIVSDVKSSYSYTYDKTGLLLTKREKFPEGFDSLSDAKIGTKYTYTFWK